LLASPLLGLQTGMPGINVLPKEKQARTGYELLAQAFGPGGPGPLQVIVPAGTDAGRVAETVRQVPGVAAAFPAQPGANGYSLITAFATTDPSSKASSELVTALRTAVPSGVLVGGPVAENHDLDQTLLKPGAGGYRRGACARLSPLLLAPRRSSLPPPSCSTSSRWAPRSVSAPWPSSTAGPPGRWASRARAT
jgi:hypothetical protein